MNGAPGKREADGRLGHTTGVVLCVPDSAGVHALRVGASSLAERTAALLAEICEQVIWIGAAPPPGAAGREVRVAAPGQSECAAIAAALEAAETDFVLVFSADRPLLSPDLAIGLAGLPDAPAAMPRNAAGAHPTCARYRRSLAGAFRAAARADVGPPLSVLATEDVRWLEGAMLEALDPDGLGLTRVTDAQALAHLVATRPGLEAGPWPGHPGLGLRSRDTSSQGA